MTTTRTGFDSASSIPEGAILSRAYWQVPGHYGEGPTSESCEAALASGLAHAKEMGYDRLTVDLRWKFEYPGGGGLDAVAERTTYSTLADAQEHLDRIRRYSGMPHSTQTPTVS